MKKAEIVFALFLLMCALVMFITSLTYPYNTQFGPGPGFFPLWVSGFMILFSLVFLFKVARNEKMGKFFETRGGVKTLILFIAAFVVALVLIPFIGLIISFGLFCLLIFRVFENYTWKISISVSIGAMVVIYFIFVVWLKVPLPTGIF